ncbi:MAG TPA: FtsQ-type POTRA domain-containing protein [Streptosporangiaceae bacterium]|nr:FtsQ-type POTRA domain-containing protein [Streptosporangiaceae bacterium]
MTGPSDTAQDRPARPGGAGAGRPAGGTGGRPGPSSGADPEGAGDRRPEHPPSRRGSAPWRAAFLVVLALVIVAGAAWALLGSSLLVVRHVQVSGNRGVPAAEVSAASAIEPGTPLARLNSASAQRRIERIPQVLSALVSRSWPDTVVIAVRERTARLAVAAGTGFELVDVHGVVVRRSASRPAGMPLLKSPPAQLRDSPAVAAAAAVLASLPAPVRARVLAVTNTAAGVTLQLRGRVTVRWGNVGRSPAKATELQALLATGARYVDVSSPQVAVTGR